MARTPSPERAEHRRFVRHFIEMVVAMMGGMMVFGALVSLYCSVTGHEGLLEHPSTSAPIMATNMTAGMSLWMWHRGHGWAAIGEMAVAMYLPVAALLLLFWAGLLPAGVLLSGTHVLMLPAMWIAMLHRRGEYIHDHHAAARAGALAEVRPQA